MSTQLTVGIGDCAVSDDRQTVLATYALGSCIAVAAYDPVMKVAGLLHILLPETGAAEVARGRGNPYLCADTGVPLLFRKAEMLGARKSRMVVRLAGGAQLLDDKGLFNIGKRNHISVKKELWKLGILVKEEMVGGTASRSVKLETGTGAYSVRETPSTVMSGAKLASQGGR